MNGHLLKSGGLRSGWARTRSGVVQAQLVKVPSTSRSTRCRCLDDRQQINTSGRDCLNKYFNLVASDVHPLPLDIFQSIISAL